MTSLIRILKFLIITVTIASCNKLYNESRSIKNEVIKTAKSEVERNTQNAISKIFPPFDHNKPDTKNNKLRFNDFIKVEITPDVIDIYCFDDAIGIDADYMFSFKCNSTTSDKIIALHGLTIDSLNTDNGFNLQHDFEWWNKDRISQLQKYSWTDGNKYHKYFWYDRVNQKAYYFDFDL